LLLLGCGNVWQVDVHSLIQVPVFLLDCIWVVWMGEGDGYAEGPGVGAFPDMVVEELLAPEMRQPGFTTELWSPTCT
jgi:hypothetical protein